MMAQCKYCGGTMDWATVEGRWVTLIPVGEDTAFEKAFQDENGNFRAKHQLVCPASSGGGAIRVIKLTRPVPGNIGPDVVDPDTGELSSKNGGE